MRDDINYTYATTSKDGNRIAQKQKLITLGEFKGLT